MENLERNKLRRGALIAAALFFFSASGCGTEDAIGPSGQWAEAGVSTGTAQTGVDAASSPPSPGGGGVLPDAGTTPPGAMDAGAPFVPPVVQPDGSISPLDASMDATPADGDGATGEGGTSGEGGTNDEGGTNGDGGTSGEGGTASGDASTDGSTPRADLGKGDGTDVVMIGDSWMSNTLQLLGTGGGIAPSLLSASRQRYRNYAVQGVMLLTSSLFGPAIPTQWDDAVRANRNIKTVIMTAGGNDIIQNTQLSNDCAQGGNLCKMKLEEIGRALGTLWAKMSAAGVQDLIHVMYAKSAGSGVKDFEANARSLEMLCGSVPAPMRCRLLSTDDLVRGELAIDDIHPTRAANDRMAKAIMDLMAAEGMRR